MLQYSPCEDQNKVKYEICQQPTLRVMEASTS